MLKASIELVDMRQDVSYDELAIAIRVLLNMTSGVVRKHAPAK